MEMLICCSSAWREEKGASGNAEDPLCGEMGLQRSSQSGEKLFLPAESCVKHGQLQGSHLFPSIAGC